MTSEPVRLGIVGLGRAFALTAPALRADRRIDPVAACAPRAESRAAFEAEFGGRGYADLDGLLAHPGLEAVYIATPHGLHAEQAIAAAAAGKHVLVEKPLAVSMADGAAMVDACDRAGVSLIVGPSHSFDAPVAQARASIESGALGRVRMIHAFNFTDFLYRPRRPEELRTEAGGGVLFSQAVHQVDVVRVLAGGLATRVSAFTGAWDPARPAEGAYSALLAFEGGAFASLTYSGYGRFDSDKWMGWVGELGHEKDPDDYGRARRALADAPTPDAESALKRARTFGSADIRPAAPHHEHFGPVIVCCERGDIRLTPDGIWVYADERRFEPASRHADPRTPVLDALVAAVRDGIEPAQTGRWGLASLEVCHAILQSARSGAPVKLTRQVAVQPEGTPR
ncbi:MAG: Gfo/Idh/MocA family oxidoreductase [Rhodospirillaceae bacterium]|nr:Gfo/Idh/MocA family oxidoreductase [Rhodospirillaceae bacterium]MYH35219.1 Gfo/Idh/MocA family oxidoreductase [Rhodospirillaceae bacterium]MYK16023.1 Gfo/Idh/MocA family oxidoreductase [Rhodospirillaceae bacterium]